MRYRVVVERGALEEIAQAYQWLAERNPIAAERWFNGLTAARDSLADLPARFPVIRLRLGSRAPVRRLICGRGRSKYHVLFVIEGDVVRVLRVRHAARRAGR